MDRPSHDLRRYIAKRTYFGSSRTLRGLAMCISLATAAGADCGVEFVWVPQIDTSTPTTQPGGPNTPPLTPDSPPTDPTTTPTSPNHDPVASIQSDATSEDTAKLLTLTAVDLDGDDLTFAIVSGPLHGTLAGLDNTGVNSATVNYSPAENFHGFDAFTFKATDGRGGSSANVAFTMTVTPVNDAPVANGQTATAESGTPKPLVLTATDVDGDLPEFEIVQTPSNGALTGTAPNVTYTSNIGFSGQDAFMFRVNDGSLFSAAVAVTLSVTALPAASGPTRFVDRNLSSSTCTTYNPATRSCSGGTATAYKTLAAASNASQPGDVFEVRAGAYNEQLNPARSGNPGSPITFRAYNGETVSLTGSPAIRLQNRDHLVIDGFTVDNTQWLEANLADHNVIRNCTFSRTPASGTTGNVRFITSHYNRILNCTLTDGNDNLILIDSDHNLIDGCTITLARHALWAIKCGDFNVIRNCTFSNPDQKIGEIYDCDDTGAAGIVQSNATKRNLVENNRFELTGASGNEKNGIQYSAQNGIIRRNVFESNFGGGIGLSGYGGEASFCTSNRVYHNVFHKNSFGGVNFSTFSSTQGTDNLFKNNVFFQNTDGGPNPAQVILRKLTGYKFENNDFFHTTAGQQKVLLYDQGGVACGNGTVTCWQTNFPALFANNVEHDPKFVSTTSHDFRLQSTSPLIDAGTFLTRTTAAGSGTTMVVQDAGWFSDGFGIAGLPGDTIQLQGQTARARIVSINYATNTITLDQPLTWTANAGVAQPFNAAAPDMGVMETGN